MNNIDNNITDITDKIIKDIYTDIEISKKLIFDFKISFLNNDIINNKLEVIGIKKYILFNLFDSFGQTMNNIEQKIIKLKSEIINIFQNNHNFYETHNSNSSTVIYKNKLPLYKYNYLAENFNTNDFYNNMNYKYLDKNNNTYNRDKTCKNNIISEHIYNKILQENNNNNKKTKNNINNDNHRMKNNGVILRKINSFNNDNSKIFLNNKSNNNEKDIISRSTTVGLGTGTEINNTNYSYLNLNNDKQNKEKLSNNYSTLSEDLKFNHYSNKNKNNNNYYKIEKTFDISNDSDIKIKSPLREVIKKISKNKNQINASFSNFFNMTYGKHNKSFDLNNKTNMSDSLIDKIKNSENLILYFSEKYGEGNFNTFLNNYKNNKISHELVEKEINMIDKIIDNNIKSNNRNVRNNNNNIRNDKYKKKYGKSIDTIIKNNRNSSYIKNTNKTHKNNKNYKNDRNKTFYQMTQKNYKTGNPSFRDDSKNNFEKNNLNITNRNVKGLKISSSFGEHYLKTDGVNNNKIKNMLPTNYFFDNNRINFTYKSFKNE